MRRMFHSRRRLVVYLDADAFAALEKLAGRGTLSSFVRDVLHALLRKTLPKGGAS